MDTGDLITIDPEILCGVPVFKGARVPKKTLSQLPRKLLLAGRIPGVLSFGNPRLGAASFGISETGLASLGRCMRILLDECVVGGAQAF